MSNECIARTIRGFIREHEATLDDMRKRAEILNHQIPIIEQEITNDKIRLKKIELLLGESRK